MDIVTAAEMQAMDRKTIDEIGLPGRVLMENAGRGATRSFLEHIYSNCRGSVGVIAGRGNNGGDGFVMARYLAQRGIPVTVFLLSNRDRLKGDAAANLVLLATDDVEIKEIPDETAFNSEKRHMQQTDCWIDAIFGTGLNADIRGYYKAVIEFINSTEKPVFAVDIPSGVHADTGQPCGVSIHAAATATFGNAKLGHLIHPGAGRCGRIDIIDIGIPPAIKRTVAPRAHLATAKTVQTRLPLRAADSHKGRTGHVLVVAAAAGKTGAAAMSATSSLRVGAGLVSLAVPQRLNPILESKVTEAMTLPMPDEDPGVFSAAAYDPISQAMEGKQCVAIGPGMGTADQTAELTRRIVRQSPLPLVIDADGLNHLAGHLDVFKDREAPTILTPHPGEMARLADTTVPEVQKDRVGAVRALAVNHGVWVVLKGARTLIGTPDGEVWINPTGNAGMASGGMGDVLTGAVAGLLAQGCSPLDASICAVYLHGLAADLLAATAPWGYMATEVMDAIPSAVYKVLNDPPPAIINGPVL